MAFYWNNNFFNCKIVCTDEYEIYSRNLKPKSHEYLDDLDVFNNQLSYSNGLIFSWVVNAYLEQKSSLVEKIKNNFIRYETFDEQSDGKILDNVCGYLQSGDFCAIMGSSGSGKTTLLNCLTLSEKNLNVESDIRINGKSVGFSELIDYCGFVKQNDLFIDVLTVKEWLTFQAFMRIGDNWSYEQKYNRIDEVLAECNLEKIQDNFIGGLEFSKGISGGEKRLLSFATQILTKPDILFCDEPTTGLDTYTASVIMDILETQAKEGKIVLCSIHQPSSQMFQRFTTLFLMSEGRVAYFGPKTKALSFFERIGFYFPFNYNPADMFISALQISAISRQQDLTRVNFIIDQFSRSENNYQTLFYLNRLHSYLNQDYLDNISYFKEQNVSFGEQFKWLLWRNFLIDVRNFYSFFFIWFTLVFCGVFIGFAYFQTSLNEKNINGLILLLVLVFGYIFFNPIMNNYIKDMPIFFRDYKDNLYSTAIYFLTKQIVDFPKFFSLGIIVMTIIYWLSNLRNDAGVFFAVLFVSYLAMECSFSFAYFISILTSDIRLSVEIAASFVISSASFCILIGHDLPLKWLKYTSWLYYMYDSVMYLVYNSYDSVPCTEPNITISSSGTDQVCPNPQCYKDGNDILDRFDITNNGWGDIIDLDSICSIDIFIYANAQKRLAWFWHTLLSKYFFANDRFEAIYCLPKNGTH
uniref:ATP-binding cassette transporter subfamily G-like protein 6 n=1 Tax=Brachionus rotundiformis TaxID=96890 RepID=A0A7H9SMV9_9BILA|nr:ATP-binding cassette transporter subfamily G-like protein 6 [Brachionus rotundiformis]